MEQLGQYWILEKGISTLRLWTAKGLYFRGSKDILPVKVLKQVSML